MIPKLDDYQKRWGIESDPIIKPGLDSILSALERLGNPQKQLRVIHIAGTNGKGSTAAFLHSILSEHGLKTASFTSPWVVDVHDQIKLDGRNITSEEMDEVFKRMKDAGISGMLTEFELLTAAAFLAFEEFQPDIVLLEAGMGGRYDSTNVITPLVSIITSIGLEHTNFLGETIKDIAWHKGGIIKVGVPVITGKLPSEAAKVIEEIAAELKSDVMRFEEEFSISRSKGSESFHFDNKSIGNLQRTLLGSHQASNMALAITTAILVLDKEFSINKTLQGVKTAVNPGRFERITDCVYMDGAHNVDSAKALTKLVVDKFGETPIHFVVGMLKDKDIEGFLLELTGVAASFTFVDFSHARAASPEELLQKCEFSRKSVKNKNKVTLDLLSSEEGVTIITGSLYLLTELREIIHGNLVNNQNS
ncbi:bifunctional folylpolyglutamate synthase/dihydrofolate synthase [Chungangia koreensis]|uniref:tetrahydrofolate synthase n=1 Tax=Chungangia koreensis TaxID=752657 RepID=A0ABV8X1T3_9LACT